jgi:hypothetical protein
MWENEVYYEVDDLIEVKSQFDEQSPEGWFLAVIKNKKCKKLL